MATPENHQNNEGKKPPEDLIKFEPLANFLKLKSGVYRRTGEIEMLEPSAILHFAAGNLDEAEMYGSDHLRSVLRMLEMYKTVVKKRGRKEDEKISILAVHQKMLLRMKESILNRVNANEWNDRITPPEMLEAYKSRFRAASRSLIDEIMVVLIKEFARAIRVYKDREKKILNDLMQIKI